MADFLRLMTHNVWNCDVNFPAWQEMNMDCSAKSRIDGLVRVYKETCPHVIGCQEVSVLMAQLLKEKCAPLGYTLIEGGYTSILYKSDRLELVESFFMRYPESVPGYEGVFNDAGSKGFNCAVFKDKLTSKLFVFATTHLWWMTSPTGQLFSNGSMFQAHSDEAREYQISLLRKKVTEMSEKHVCPAVAVGDFNTDYRSKAVSELLKNGFNHAHNIATDFSDETVGYHNCFPSGFDRFYSNKPFEDAIDHIFLFNEKSGAVKRFERYSPEYYLPISDHSPAFIDVEF